MHPNSIVVAVCGASTDQELLTEVQKQLQEVDNDPHVFVDHVVSISHDVLVQPDGSYLWTALITIQLR